MTKEVIKELKSLMKWCDDLRDIHKDLVREMRPKPEFIDGYKGAFSMLKQELEIRINKLEKKNE